MTWWPELGLGYYPVTAAPYDAAYFERYKEQAKTPIGFALNKARCDLVERFTRGMVVDIGIGAGTFIEWRIGRLQATYGFDINPAGEAWLRRHGLFFDPYAPGLLPAITCWDVLEHIHDFERLISRVRDFVFVSIPIFHDADHVLKSKHFRRDEHCWYFTKRGLVRTFVRLGFNCLEVNDTESRIGREDVLTFVFKRVSP